MPALMIDGEPVKRQTICINPGEKYPAGDGIINGPQSCSVRCNNYHVETWLNGVRITEFFAEKTNKFLSAYMEVFFATKGVILYDVYLEMLTIYLYMYIKIRLGVGYIHYGNTEYGLKYSSP